MEICSLTDLNKVEARIAKAFRRLKLGDVLRSLYLLRKSSPGLRPFMVAGVALFAARFCLPSKASQLINNYDIRLLVNLSNKFYLASPITFDKDLHDEFMESNPVFMMLRLVTSQFPFEPGMFSEFSRPALLFHDIPQQLKCSTDVPQFDFENKFQAITGVSVLDFIATGFVISSASHGNFAVNKNYFKKIRNQGIKIPDD